MGEGWFEVCKFWKAFLEGFEQKARSVLGAGELALRVDLDELHQDMAEAGMLCRLDFGVGLFDWIMQGKVVGFQPKALFEELDDVFADVFDAILGRHERLDLRGAFVDCVDKALAYPELGIVFGGVPIAAEDLERIAGVMEGFFR